LHSNNLFPQTAAIILFPALWVAVKKAGLAQPFLVHYIAPVFAVVVIPVVGAVFKTEIELAGLLTKFQPWRQTTLAPNKLTISGTFFYNIVNHYSKKG